jgi:hypothetical protein
MYLCVIYFIQHCAVTSVPRTSAILDLQLLTLPSFNFCVLTVIDGQIRLVSLVRVQTDNFRLFLRQQTDIHQISV